MALKAWLLGLVLAVVGFGCSSAEPKKDGFGNDFTPEAGGASSGQGGGSAGLSLVIGGSANEGGNCGGISRKAESMPVDMFFMFDQSSSMGDLIPGTSVRWWDAAAQAFQTFVNDPTAASANLGVGIQYFPLNGVEPASCTAPYATPEVPVGLLPGVSPALSGSIAQHGPSTFTPSGPALQGALDYMRTYAKPGRAAAVVFVTDGFPTECEPRQISDIANLAKAAYEAVPPIRTFVVGFSQGLENLDTIAKAGGTEKAFLIEGGTDVTTEFVHALLGISSTTLNCDFPLDAPPDGSVLDPKKVSVMYTPNATGNKGEITKLNNLGECALHQNSGWYYDAPTNPSKIIACPGTCSRFAAGVIEIRYGCTPIEGPPT